MNLSSIKDHYTSDFLEGMYTHIRLSHAFVAQAEADMQVGDAPVDDLYELVEHAFAVVDELYDVLCKLTERERIDIVELDFKRKNAPDKT